MTEELITATNKNGEDRSVSNADRLLTPGSDKAGDLGKAALLPAPDGMSLLEAGASRDERKSSLRRIGRGVVDLVYRLMKRTGWRSADESHEASDNASGDSESEHSHAEGELDELTLRRIEKIEEEWEFRANVNSSNGNFTPKSYPDFAGSIASGNYEEIEKLIPEIRELVANDDRLDPESEEYDEAYLLDLAKSNVAALFRKHYEHMPKLADNARRAMQKQIDFIYSLKDDSSKGDYFDYDHEHEPAVIKAVIKLMNAESMLPEGITEEFRDIIINEVAEVVETAANSEEWLVSYEYVSWLADHGFPPERWPQDARDREDFPEPLRRLLSEQDEDTIEDLDCAVIRYCINKTEVYDDKGEMKPDVHGRCDLIREYFEGRLPDVYPYVMSGGIMSMVTSQSSNHIYLQIDRCYEYIKTIREIGQENANKLGEELGITHFSDWSPEVLRGTLHILETGRTKSGNPATMIIRGDSGDHNGAAHAHRNIKSTDMFAVEISNTGILSGIVKKLEEAGVDSSTFYSVILFGHGGEDAFAMSYGEKIPPDSQEWYNKKGLRDLVTALAIDTIVLNSCHPLVREEDKFEPLTLGEGFQRRRGTAVAISKAFPQVRVISGLDGVVYFLADKTDYTNIETGDYEGNRTSTMAETRNGRTRVYKKGADRQ